MRMRAVRRLLNVGVDQLQKPQEEGAVAWVFHVRYELVTRPVAWLLREIDIGLLGLCRWRGYSGGSTPQPDLEPLMLSRRVVPKKLVLAVPTPPGNTADFVVWRVLNRDGDTVSVEFVSVTDGFDVPSEFECKVGGVESECCSLCHLPTLCHLWRLNWTPLHTHRGQRVDYSSLCHRAGQLIDLL